MPQLAPKPDPATTTAVSKETAVKEILRDPKNQAAVLALDPDDRIARPAEKARAPIVVNALVKAAGLPEGKYSGQGIFQHNRGEPVELDIRLIRVSTGEVTRIQFYAGERGGLAEKARPESVTFSTPNDIRKDYPGFARLRIAAQLQLDISKVDIELQSAGKDIFSLQPAERESVKQLSAVLRDKETKKETKVEVDPSTGRVLPTTDLLALPKRPVVTTPTLQTAKPPIPLNAALDGRREVVLGGENLVHLKAQQNLAAKIGVHMLTSLSEEGTIEFHKVKNNGNEQLASIKLSATDLSSGRWQDRLSKELGKQLGDFLIQHYKGKGIEEYIRTGEIPQNASAEFKADFEKDLRLAMGLPKDAKTTLQTDRPTTGKLAGGTIATLVNANNEAVGAFRFVHDAKTDTYSTQQSAVLAEVIPSVLPK
jgi:hypothetical protein